MKNLQSKWPAWFPYPSAWLQSLVLLILLIPLGISVKFFGTIGIRTLTVTGNLGFTFLLGAIGAIAPFVAFAYVHSRMRGQFPKRWPTRVPSPLSIWEAFYALSVMILAGLVSTAVTLIFVDVRKTYQPAVQQTMNTVLFAAWMISAAYLYQAKHLIWQGIVAVLEKQFKAQTEEARQKTRAEERSNEEFFGEFGVSPPPRK